MRLVLDNVAPQYIGVLRELATALQFTISEADVNDRRAEIDRRIERLEAGKTTVITPDWETIQQENGLS
nr:hypothetical protein [uncultured Arsenicibacter sp.]